MTDFYELQSYHASEQRDRQRQNSTRAGRSAHVYTTHGAGQSVLDVPLAFELPFLQEPFFTSGMTLVQGADSRFWRWPVASCGVHKWQLNSRGHYLGAYLYFDVRVASVRDDIGDDGMALQLARLQLAELRKRTGPMTAEQVRALYESNLEEARMAGPGKVVVAHHLLFQAMAFQDMGSVVLNDAYHLTPRRVGIL